VDHRCWVAVLASLTLPTSSAAQVQSAGYPSPAEYAERAEWAERAPLFQSDAPLPITLRTDIAWLRDERNDSVDVEGTMVFVDLNGAATTKTVDVRARGAFRRDRRNCNFPPLRLDFPTSEMAGTVFEGQDRLKLVTPCQDGRDDYQRYIYDEYLAYRVLNLLTPYSYRVRLVEVTYEDVGGRYDRTKVGFLIESDEQMAQRNQATFEEAHTMHPRDADGTQSVVVALFNYMIGNSDWDPVTFHNVRLIRSEDGRYLTVPYDFDFSGVVRARYAVPSPAIMERYGIRSVRQRVYRGFCRPELQYEPLASLFGSRRADVEALYRGFDRYGSPSDAEEALDYYEDFWKVFESADEFRDRILDECRDIGLS